MTIENAMLVVGFFGAEVALRAVCSFLAACSLSKIQHIQDHPGSSRQLEKAFRVFGERWHM
jgi:hypothetical protein